MGGSRAKVGPDQEPAGWFDYVVVIDPETGLPLEYGGGSGGSLSAVATADPPTYEEGESASLSMDLDGNLRVAGSFSASTVGTANAAAPTYSEAQADAPLSFNLTGDLRTIAKQSGAWTVGLSAGANVIGAVTQSGTWTVSLPTGAATSAAQTTGNNSLSSIDTKLSSVASETTLDAVKTAVEAIQAEAESSDPVSVTKSKSTPYFNGDVGSTKYLVATGAQVLTDYFIENPDTSNKAYVQFFNAASTGAVTLGTTAPVRAIGLAAGEKANLADLAIDFSAGIVIAGTTTATGSDGATTGLVVNLGHRAG